MIAREEGGIRGVDPLQQGIAQQRLHGPGAAQDPPLQHRPHGAGAQQAAHACAEPFLRIQVLHDTVARHGGLSQAPLMKAQAVHKVELQQEQLAEAVRHLRQQALLEVNLHGASPTQRQLLQPAAGPKVGRGHAHEVLWKDLHGSGAQADGCKHIFQLVACHWMGLRGEPVVEIAGAHPSFVAGPLHCAKGRHGVEIRQLTELAPRVLRVQLRLRGGAEQRQHRGLLVHVHEGIVIGPLERHASDCSGMPAGRLGFQSCSA
mmetsp:Transcript_126620/g.300818  ORF Transcript_126620/g.300818 Transcript_126620/m.300818 type:complete len:261 (+) Transcript_126620:1564-2346(+)